MEMEASAKVRSSEYFKFMLLDYYTPTNSIKLIEKD
jgi:hypothetical protein